MVLEKQANEAKSTSNMWEFGGPRFNKKRKLNWWS